MKNILFVCTGNTCRSPMAQGLFNAFAAENNIAAAAFSAGLCVTETAVSENAVKAMRLKGIDIAGYTPQQLDLSLLNKADIVFTMSKSHAAALPTGFNVHLLYELAGEKRDITDPYGKDLCNYIKTAEEIEKLIELYNINF